MKQRVYERVHKTKFRRRHAVRLYGDPDAFEALRLDADAETREKEKQKRFLYGEESRRKPRTVDDDDDDDAYGGGRVGGILSAVFGPGAQDPDLLHLRRQPARCAHPGLRGRALHDP